MKYLLAFHARRSYLLQWTTSWLLRSLQSKSSSPFPTCENVIFPILRNYQLLRLDHWGRPSIKDIFPRKLHHSQKGTHGLCTPKPFLGGLQKECVIVAGKICWTIPKRLKKSIAGWYLWIQFLSKSQISSLHITLTVPKINSLVLTSQSCNDWKCSSSWSSSCSVALVRTTWVPRG